jgi:hypothetical protein
MLTTSRLPGNKTRQDKLPVVQNEQLMGLQNARLCMYGPATSKWTEKTEGREPVTAIWKARLPCSLQARTQNFQSFMLYYVTNSIIPLNTIPLHKLIVAQLFKQFIIFYATRRSSESPPLNPVTYQLTRKISFLPVLNYLPACLPITTVVGANLCARDPLEIKGNWIRGVGGVADKEAYTVHTINIISQRLYFVARCLSSYVRNVSLHSTCVCFPSIRKLVT